MPEHLGFKGRVFYCVFLKAREFRFCFFFFWNLQTVFPFKPMFSKGPSYLVLLFVSTFVIMLKKSSYNLDHICQFCLWTLTKDYSMSAIVGNMRKNGPKTFLPDARFYFEKFGSRPLRSKVNDQVVCTIRVKRPCVSLWSVPWRLSCSIVREKLGQNIFFVGNIAFFEKFVFSTTS